MRNRRLFVFIIGLEILLQNKAKNVISMHLYQLFQKQLLNIHLEKDFLVMKKVLNESHGLLKTFMSCFTPRTKFIKLTILMAMQQCNWNSNKLTKVITTTKKQYYVKEL